MAIVQRKKTQADREPDNVQETYEGEGEEVEAPKDFTVPRKPAQVTLRRSFSPGRTAYIHDHPRACIRQGLCQFIARRRFLFPLGILRMSPFVISRALR
jgi:hypothetical protein